MIRSGPRRGAGGHGDRHDGSQQGAGSRGGIRSTRIAHVPRVRDGSRVPFRRGLVYDRVYREVYDMPRIMVMIDDALLAEARRLTGARTKRETIEIALREAVRRRKLAELATMAGRVDIRLTRRQLDAMRTGR